MCRKTFQIMLMLLISLLGFGQFSHAKDPAKYSLKDASEFVSDKHEGKILSAKTKSINGEKVHRIKVLTEEGRLIMYQVNENVLNKKNLRNNNSTQNKRINQTRKRNQNRTTQSYRNQINKPMRTIPNTNTITIQPKRETKEK